MTCRLSRAKRKRQERRGQPTRRRRPPRHKKRAWLPAGLILSSLTCYDDMRGHLVPKRTRACCCKRELQQGGSMEQL